MIWTLRLLSASSALCAIVALIVSLSAQSSNIAAHHREQVNSDRAIQREQAISERAIQASRQHSAQDTCELVRAVVLVSSTPANAARVRNFIARTPMHDCRAYSIRVTTVPLPKVGVP